MNPDQNNMNLQDALKGATELTGQSTQPTQPQVPQVPQQAINPGAGLVIPTPKPMVEVERPMIEDDDYVLVPTSTGELAILDPNEVPEAQKVQSNDAFAHIAESIAEMDVDINVAARQARENGYRPDWKETQGQGTQETAGAVNGEPTAEVNPTEDAPAENTSDETGDNVLVVIDKLGMAPVFTPEEQEKLERAKKIKVQEVETVDIKTLRSKKGKKQALSTILKRSTSLRESAAVFPASGYTASLQGLTTYELMGLMKETNNDLIDAQRKWSMIHSKLKECSLGDLGFTDFLKATAAADYTVFIFALLTATYPSDDVIPLICSNPECNKQFDHKYSIRSLMRTDTITPDLQKQIATIVDNSVSLEGARQVHEDAPVNLVKTIKLPESGYVVELYVQSAYDLIFKSIKGGQEIKDPEKQQAILLSSTIKAIHIPDTEDPEGGYYTYEDTADIVDILYSLQAKDILLTANQTEGLINTSTFEFGLTDVNCPHCNKHDDAVAFDIEQILFYQYQQEMNTSVE